LCILNLAKAAKLNMYDLLYHFFINNIPDQFHLLSIADSLEEINIVTETYDFLFSSTLDTFAPFALKED